MLCQVPNHPQAAEAVEGEIGSVSCGLPRSNRFCPLNAPCTTPTEAEVASQSGKSGYRGLSLSSSDMPRRVLHIQLSEFCRPKSI